MKNNTGAPSPNISFYLAPATCVHFYKDATILDVYRCITDPKVAKRQTEALRQMTDKNQRAQYKRSAFHYCTFSGSFGSNRTNNGLIKHSGLLCLDFDHVRNVDETKRRLLSDNNFRTLLLFTSPSGDGLKWVIPIDLSKATHEQWFCAICYYLQKEHQLIADPACKNVARACFIPYDPEAYIDPTLLPEIQPVIDENPAVLGLINTLSANNIKIDKYGK